MKTYTYQEIKDNPSILDDYSYKDDVPLRCNHCDTVYYRKQKDVKEKTFTRNSDKNYCSLSCLYQQRTKERNSEVSCSNCKTVFLKKDSQSKRSSNHFCSRSCAVTYNNKNKTHGTRRSKLEAWLEEHLVRLYPDLEFHFNQKDAIGSELDIYIPALRLAFELNGIFHYEPIFGNDKLQQIQQNDSNKFQLCQQHQISLCIVDTSQQKHFKPKVSEKYLNILTDIIDKNLVRVAEFESALNGF